MMLRRAVYLGFALCLLSTLPALGATVEVGLCSSYLPYATIQEAVNASNPGDTIYVCPGNHAEQVTIGISLTLQGLEIGPDGGAAAVVTVPFGGTVQNATALGGYPVDAQIFINNGANVTINNLTVNGQGNGINSCAPDLIGIYFQNASGKVVRSAVLNEVEPTGLTGCQAGEGVFVESGNSGTSTVKVNYTTIENYQKNAITGNGTGTTLTVTNNTIVGQGSTTGAAENGIQIAFGAAGTISANTVSDDIWGPDTHSDEGDAASGILVYASKGVSITSNQVTNTQYGIVVVSDPVLGAADDSTITSNTVNATRIFDAIDACSNSNNVSSNTINGADQSGIHLDDTCGSTGNNNTVSNNAISVSCAGILTGTGTTGNTTSGDAYYNVITQTVPGDSCQAPGFEFHKKPAPPKVSPTRH